MWVVVIAGGIGVVSLALAMMPLAIPYWVIVVAVAAIGTWIGDAMGSGWIGLAIGTVVGIVTAVTIVLIQFKRSDDRDRQQAQERLR